MACLPDGEPLATFHQTRCHHEQPHSSRTDARVEDDLADRTGDQLHGVVSPPAALIRPQVPMSASVTWKVIDGGSSAESKARDAHDLRHSHFGE